MLSKPNLHIVFASSNTVENKIIIYVSELKITKSIIDNQTDNNERQYTYSDCPKVLAVIVRAY